MSNSRARPSAIYRKRDGLFGDCIFRLFEDSHGDIWIGTIIPGEEGLTRWERATETFHRYSPADGIPDSPPTAFCEDASGNLWVGYYGGGLARYRAGRFTFFSGDDGVPPGLIMALYLDSAGRLWVATSEGGAARVIDPAADHPRFSTYGTANGLSSDEATCVTEDQWGMIYIGTGRGVDKLDAATGHIKHYTTADGLASSFVRVSFRDRNGALWFGTLKGLSRLIPEPDRPMLPPPVLISALRTAGVSYPLSELGAAEVAVSDLSANRNQIQVDFFGLSSSVGDVLRYQYKLEGADADWSAPSDQRTVNYANLAPGSYRFLVRAVSADGTLSPTPATVLFKILPPIWRRWWFVTTAALMFASAVFAFARSRYERLKALRESENRFRTLAETASDAILTIDEESRIVLVNQAAEKVFGYTHQEMIGRELTMLMPDYLRHLHQAGFARYNLTGKRHISWKGIELPGLHKNGREIPLEISFGEFTKDDKRFFTGIARDITERKRAEEALRKSREERLLELERVRARIATDLHDDIGSSLTQIAILSEVAHQRIGSDDAEQGAEPLVRIISVANELVEAMSDIVWAINPKKDHLNDLSQRMRRFASDIFTTGNIAFQFRSPDREHDIELGANVRREIFLIFKESINNIVKHSACTRAEIEFQIEGDWLALKVTDNGKGFDLALAADGSAPIISSARGGNGILSMRKRAQEMGGNFEILSRNGEGTTTTLRVLIIQRQPEMK